MSVTITATPQPATASVLLSITSDAADGPVVLLRTDNTGTRPVRLLEGQGLVGGSLVVTDYEPALRGVVLYQVIDGDDETGSTSLTDLTAGPEAILSLPVVPQWRTEVHLVTRVVDQRDSGTVHEVIGRPDPIVTLVQSSTRRGPIELWAPDHEAAVEIADVLGRGEVALLRATVPRLSRYLIGRSVIVEPAADPTTPRRWVVTVDHVEVAAPADPLRGSLGWSFDDVLAEHATFDVLHVSWETFNELTIGPPA